MRAVVAVLLCVTAAHAALWGVLREKQQAPDFRGVLPSVSYAPFEGSGHPDVDNIPSVEKIRADERFQHFLRWLYKQKTETIFKSCRNRTRTDRKYR